MEHTAMGQPTYGALPWPVCQPAWGELIRTGRVYRLGFPMSATSPYASVGVPTRIRLHLRHSDTGGDGAFSEANEAIEMCAHNGTHVDALCHVSEMVGGQPVVYGDIPAQSIEGEAGFTQLGVEHCPPIVGRGVLLDVPRFLGRDVPRFLGREVLPDSYGISAGELQGCLEAEGVSLQAGDIALVRTGFTRYRDRERRRFLSRGAGPTAEACRWLGEQGIVATGSDTVSYEQVPSPHVGHLELMRRRGILLMKQLNLEELSADGVFAFLFVACPIGFVGATASPISPVAIA